MKKFLSILLILLLILCSLTFTACGTPGMKLISVKDLKNSNDEKLQDLAESLSLLDRCKDDEYVCILTDEAKGKVVTPFEVDGKRVKLITAFSGACDNIKSLRIEGYYTLIEHICSFEGSNDTLRTFISESPIEVMSDCFNECAELDYISAVISGDIKNSFCGCPLMKESIGMTDSASHSVISSYNDCPAIEDIELSNITELSDSFNRCDAIGKVTINEADASISECFNNCTALETADLQVKSVSDSFNDCKALGELNTSASAFTRSFNSCTSLKNITAEHDIETLSDSFADCPADVKKLKSKDTQQREKEQYEKEREEQRISSNHYFEITAVMDDAIEKLWDDGIIPVPEGSEYNQHKNWFDDDEHFIFLDSEAEARLTAAPDLSGGKIYTTLDMEGHEDRLAEYYDDCRYYAEANAYTTKVDEDYYMGGFDRGHATTMLFIVDLKTGEIIHIHEVGIDIPPSSTTTYHTSGDTLSYEAGEYLKSLLD